jgi:RHS repeat-associated protein
MTRALLALLVLLAPGAALAQASPSPFTTGFRYDAAHRLIGTIDPDPDGAGSLHYPAVRNTYDPAGRMVRVEKGELAAWQSEAVAPSAWSGFTVYERTDTAYDALDRPVTSSEMVGGVAVTLTQTSYDNAGRVDCVAVRMNPGAFASPPAACTPGAATGDTEPDRITRNSYDAAGQLLKVQKAYGTPLQQDYATYEYTLDGKPSAVIDANRNRAKLTYDGHGRQARWIFPSATPPQPGQAGVENPADYEEYGYDLNGNRTTLRKRDGVTIAYAYDALNRVTQKNVPASAAGAPGYSVFTGYDNRGLELYARFGSASGVGITNSYDNAGRLASTSTNMDGTPKTISHAYDGDGNRSSISISSGYYLGFFYDGLDRMTAIRQSDGTTVASLAYDPAGRRSGLGFYPGNAAAYAYDGTGRLQTLSHHFGASGSDQTLSFAYSPAHQIVARTSSNDAYASTSAYNVSRAYTANGLNQYTAAGTATFAYDANGNLTSDGSSTFVYDAENRLVSRSNGTTLSYDPLGRLWRIAGPSETTVFEYDGDRLVEEFDGSGTRTRVYGHGANEDEPLVWWEGSDNWSRRYLHADHQGSIIAIANDYGNTQRINAYDSWGIRNAGDWGRFGYTGQVWLTDLGMYYYKARIYSPTLGRFLQEDPVGYEDQINLYAYVQNDPISNKDSTGRDTKRNQIPVRQVVILTPSRARHIMNDHNPGTPRVASKFAHPQTTASLQRRAGETVAAATDQGTRVRENDRYVFEAQGSFLDRHLTPPGSQGETYTRVVASPLESVGNPQLKAEALAELAKLAPEVAKNLATDGQGSKPVEVWVVITIHPVKDADRKTSDSQQ